MRDTAAELAGRLAVQRGLLTAEEWERHQAEWQQETSANASIGFLEFLVRRKALLPADAAAIRAALEVHLTPDGPLSTILFAGDRPVITEQSDESTLPDLQDVLSSVLRETLGEAGYKIHGLLGRGGMGVVYEVAQRPFDRHVALKVLSGPRAENPEQVHRFLREAWSLAQLNHPNICPVYDVGWNARRGIYYFAMKKVVGRSLDEALAAREQEGEQACKGQDLAHWVRVLIQICDGVSYAHAQGVLHRDLKPANVMLGEFGEVLVMDWGLAKLAGRPELHADRLMPSDQATEGELLSVDGQIIGTPEYMPPEQARGRIAELGDRSDVYSLGAILYQVLTGCVPVEGRHVMDTLVRVAENRITAPRKRTPRRTIPFDLASAAMKALAAKPEDRYSSVRAFREDLQAFLEGRALAAADYTLPQLTGMWVRRHRGVALTACIAVLLLAISTSVYINSLLGAQRAEASARKLAEEEAINAQSQAEEARQAEARAVYQETETRRRWAESQAAQGRVLLREGQWRQARDRFSKSNELFRQTGVSVNDGLAGLVQTTRLLPYPLHVLGSYRDDTRALCFLPDGRHVLAGSDDRCARLWDTETGREVRVFSGHRQKLTAVVALPDGRSFVTASNDETIILWALEEGATQHVFRGHTDSVLCLALTRDGRRLLSGASDGTIRLWDIGARMALKSIVAGEEDICAVAFMPDDQRAVTVDLKGVVRRWDLRQGSGQEVFRIPGKWGSSLAVSSDGHSAVTGGVDDKVRVWDLKSGSETHCLTGHTQLIYAVAMSPDGRRVLSGSHDRTARLWDLETGRCLRLFEHDGLVLSVAFSPDGRWALTGDAGSVKLWNLETDGDVLAMRGKQRGIGALAFLPDGRSMLSGCMDGTATLWDAATGCRMREHVGAAGWVNDVAVTRDGTHFVTAHRHNVLKIWEAATGREVNSMRGHEDLVAAVDVSPNGQLVVSAARDKTIRLWDLKSGRSQAVLRGHTEWPEAVAFSPDGSQILSGGRDKTVRLWDVTERRERKLLQADGAVVSLAFSPDGRFALSGDSNRGLILWSLETGERERVLKGHTSVVCAVAFAPEGHMALSASQDRTVRLWNWATGAELTSFEDLDEEYHSAAFAPDGLRVVAATRKGSIRLWDLAYGLRAQEYYEGVRSRMGFEDPEALAARAKWLMFRGFPKKARFFFERAAMVKPEAVGALPLARACWRAGDTAGARRAFARALERKMAPAEYLRRCMEGLAHDEALRK